MTEERQTQIYASIARKGGVTKSTLTGNLGAALAAQGYRVVMIESDGQGSLSKLCGVKPHNGFYQLIAEDAEFADTMVRVPEKFAGEGELYLISSHDQQMTLATWTETSNRIYARFNELRGWADYILVDTSPAIDEINNAWFYVADKLLLPTLCERLSVDHLRDQTIAYIRTAQVAAKEADVPVAQIHGIIPNRYDKATNVDRVNIGVLQGRHGDEIRIFPLICNAAVWKSAAQLSMSITTMMEFRVKDTDTSKLRQQARIAYRELAPILESMTGVAV